MGCTLASVRNHTLLSLSCRATRKFTLSRARDHEEASPTYRLGCQRFCCARQNKELRVPWR